MDKHRARLINFGAGLAARVLPGLGEKVFWIHGYTLDSRSWAGLWNLLPDWYHVGLDLPGHGTSLPLSSDDDLPRLAQRIGRLAHEQGIRHIVALSFGTVVALQVVIELPSLFDSLILGAPALGGGPQEAQVGTRYEELTSLYRTRGFGPHLRECWMKSPPNIFKGAEDQPDLWSCLWHLVGDHAWWELGDDSYARLMNQPQTIQQLRRVTARTLVLVGENELDAFKRCGELVRRGIPGCKRIYVNDVGHLCMLEDPKQFCGLMESHWQNRNPAISATALAGGNNA